MIILLDKFFKGAKKLVPLHYLNNKQHYSTIKALYKYDCKRIY